MYYFQGSTHFTTELLGSVGGFTQVMGHWDTFPHLFTLGTIIGGPGIYTGDRDVRPGVELLSHHVVADATTILLETF